MSLSKPAYYAIACGVILLGAIAVIIWKNAIANQLDTWKVLPREEQLTQLYFSDHKTLPQKAVAGEKQDVRFTIRNVENQPVTYTYTIFAQAKDARTQLAQGTVKLVDNQAQDITKQLTLPDTPGRVAIVIDLQYALAEPHGSKTKNQTQTIHYWVTMEAPRASEEEQDV